MSLSKTIYRFYPYLPHDLDSLANSYLWFSKSSDFNDPFEDVFISNMLDIDNHKYDEVKAIKFLELANKNNGSADQVYNNLLNVAINGKLQAIYEGLIRNVVDKLHNDFSNFLEKSRFCCFVEDRDSIALESKLMWSHYANGMRGFCVEFDREKLINGIMRINNINVEYGEIVYAELTKYSLHETLMNVLKKTYLNHEVVGISDLMTMKSNEWSYENELRLKVNDINAIQYDCGAVKSITFGDKIPKAKLNTLISVLRGNPLLNCELYEATIDLNNFKIIRRLIGHSRSGLLTTA
ncbi:DUF2971 domain-containing protein [Plesiomonas shigelloides]|uniref:DUF2971 domain-containing protein n=1 Tax=Plesiomonas shigelloides TaxID=703 RepID=UPI00325FF326